jgi:zinc transporter 1
MKTHTSLIEHHHHHHHSEAHPDPEAETSPGTQSPTASLHQDELPPKEALANLALDNHANHHHTHHTPNPPGRDLGMLGALLHVAGDALNNAGVIIAAAVMWLVPTAARARFYADPAVGLAIALTVLASAVPLVRRSGEILLQSAPAGVRLGDVRADMERVDGVVSVHELRTFDAKHKSPHLATVLVSAPFLLFPFYPPPLMGYLPP